MIYESPELFNRQSRLLDDFEKSVPGDLNDLSTAFDDSAYDLSGTLQTAPPAARNQVLEDFMRAGSGTFWEPLTSPEFNPSESEGARNLPSRVFDALAVYSGAKKAYLKAREEVHEQPRTRTQLINSVVKIKSQLGEDEATLQDAKSLERQTLLRGDLETLDQIENLALTSMSGYEVELLKWHLYNTINRLDSRGYLTDAPVPSDPHTRKIRELEEKYDIKFHQPFLLLQSHLEATYTKDPDAFVDEAEDDLGELFWRDHESDDLIQPYYQDIVDRKAKHYKDIYKELLTAEKRSRLDVDREDAQIGLKIKGNIPEKLKPDKLFNFLAQNVPPIALAGARLIEFRQFSPAEERWDFAGVVEKDSFIGGLFYERSKLVEVNLKRMESHKQLKKIVMHELGHGFIRSIHPGDLDDFDKLRATERVHVTDYVKYIAENIPERAPSEDFAETFALFWANPRRLRKIAPGRYALMQEMATAY